MALSTQTLDHLLESESHLRAAIKSASSNESPNIIYMLSKILSEIEQVKKFENLMDLLDKQTKDGNNGTFKFF